MIVRPQARRGGSTIAEVAVVISVFLLFLFGIFEYCRFIMALHATINACRDGARYAVVNINKPDDFDTHRYQLTRSDGTTVDFPSVVEYTRARMAGVDRMYAHTSPTSYYTSTGTLVGTAKCKIEVYPCDPAQLNVAAPATPVVAPKPSYTRWNEAEFRERIAVRASGEYRPALPNFLLMGNAIPINIVVTMGSEG